MNCLTGYVYRSKYAVKGKRDACSCNLQGTLNGTTQREKKKYIKLRYIYNVGQKATQHTCDVSRQSLRQGMWLRLSNKSNIISGCQINKIYKHGGNAAPSTRSLKKNNERLEGRGGEEVGSFINLYCS